MKLERIKSERKSIYIIYRLDEIEKQSIPQYLKNKQGKPVYLGQEGYDIDVKYDGDGTLHLASTYDGINSNMKEFTAYLREKGILKDESLLLFKFNKKLIDDSLNIENKISDLSREIHGGVKNNDRDYLINLLEQSNRTINELYGRINQLRQELNIDNISEPMRDNLSEKIDLLPNELSKVEASLEFIKTRIINLASEKNIKNIQTDKLSYIVDNLEAPSDPQLIQKILLDKETANSRFVYKGKKLPSDIKRIALYSMPESNYNLTFGSENQHISDDAVNRTIFEVTYVSGEKKLMRIGEGIISTPDLHSLFVQEKAYLDYTSHYRGTGPLGSGFFGGGLQGYNEEIERDYDTIHKQIDSQLENIIIHNAKQPVELLFIGCGKGEEIKYIQSYLEKNQIKYVIYGLDKEPGNIIEAEKQPEFKGKNIHFLAGDAIDIDVHIKKFRRLSSQAPGTSIVVSSGFLTRKVNSDSVEAFEIFKKAAHLSDTIIISGRTDTLISKRDAKSSGMNDTQTIFQSGGEDRTLSIYKIIPINEQVKKHFSDGVIKLQDHARPIEIILWHIQNKTDFQLIDLRSAYIDLEQKTASGECSALELLVNLLINEEKSILVTGEETWYKSLCEEIAIKDPKSLDRIEMSKSNTRLTQFTTFKDQMMTITERPKISENLEDRAKKEINKLTK